MSTPELRKIWKEYYKERDRIWSKCKSWPYPNIPFPDILMGMTCGAKTRKGTPCKRKDIYQNCRCRLHGGLSTGPKTKAGKRRSAMNGF